MGKISVLFLKVRNRDDGGRRDVKFMEELHRHYYCRVSRDIMMVYMLPIL